MSVSRLTRTASFARAVTWSSLLLAALGGFVLRPHAVGEREATASATACASARPQFDCPDVP